MSSTWQMEVAGMPDAEAELVRRARQGDKAAFVDLYRQHQPAIYTYVYYRVGDVMLAEDLTAEVFVRLVDKIATFRPGRRPILAWLYTIAGNLVTDHYRRNGRVKLLSFDEQRDQAGTMDLAAITQRRITTEHLVHALGRLTEEQRLVIILKFVERRSNAEVGSLMGKREGAVKSLQHRALATLRRILEKERSYEGP